MPVGHWGCRAGTVIDAEPCSQVSCDAACSRTQATTGDPRHESESAYVIWGQDCQSDSDPLVLELDRLRHAVTPAFHPGFDPLTSSLRMDAGHAVGT